MANTLLTTRSLAPESTLPRLNATVEQQVVDILEEVKPERQAQSPSQRVKPAQWGYGVPFAGVRYYSY